MGRADGEDKKREDREQKEFQKEEKRDIFEVDGMIASKVKSSKRSLSRDFKMLLNSTTRK